jgi:geranylgeranylglycerol-phosphate geranylgeranyltransferase
MAYIRILRPVNCLIVFISVILGYLTAKESFEPVPLQGLLWSALAAFFITGYGNIINDIFDAEADALNRPDRPIPAGKIGKKGAGRYAIILLVTGLLFARAVSNPHFFIAFLVAGLLWFYSIKLKGTILFGNIVIAAFLGITLFYGGLLSSGWPKSLIPALFAFLINMAREIVKDTADTKGDQASRMQTLPIRYGNRAALAVSSVFLIVLVLLTFFPYVLGFYNRYYLIIVVPGVDIPLLFIVFFLFKRGLEKTVLNRISIILKVLMVIGILAIIVGRMKSVCAYAFSV